MFHILFRLRLVCNKGERSFVRDCPLSECFEIRDGGIEPVDVLFTVSSVVLSFNLEIRLLLRGTSSGGCGCIFVLQSHVCCCNCFPSEFRSSIKETLFLSVQFGRFRGCPFFAFVFETLDFTTWLSGCLSFLADARIFLDETLTKCYFCPVLCRYRK